MHNEAAGAAAPGEQQKKCVQPPLSARQDGRGERRSSAQESRAFAEWDALARVYSRALHVLTAKLHRHAPSVALALRDRQAAGLAGHETSTPGGPEPGAVEFESLAPVAPLAVVMEADIAGVGSGSAVDAVVGEDEEEAQAADDQVQRQQAEGQTLEAGERRDGDMGQGRSRTGGAWPWPWPLDASAAALTRATSSWATFTAAGDQGAQNVRVWQGSKASTRA